MSLIVWHLKVTNSKLSTKSWFDLLSVITLETGWILKVIMFHINSMILEVKRSLTVFLLIHLKVIYQSFLSVFTVHIFVHIIVSIFISSPATKLHIKWLDLHTLSITIYISSYHHIIISSPWHYHGLIVKFCVHFKSKFLYVIHGHFSLSNTTYFFILSNEANYTVASFWSGGEEDYLPDLLLTISSYSDDTNPFSTTDKELITTFLLPQQSANHLPKYTFTYSWKHFLYMKSSIKIKTHVPKNHYNKWPNRNWPAVKGN